MKSKHILLLIFLATFCISESLFSQTAQDTLAGTWVFDYSKSLTEMNQNDTDYYNQKSTIIKNSMSQFYTGRTFVFNTDGSFTQTELNNNTISGTWVLTNDVVTITYTNNRVFTLEVLINNDIELVLKPNITSISNGRLTLPEWHFTKN